jgi:hypothetical protein
MADLDLLLEAERRGLLPADKQGLLNEARSRGLIGGGIQSIKQPPKERTFGEAATDIAASVGKGLGQTLQVPGQLLGLITGDVQTEKPSGLQGLGKALEEKSEAAKSESLRAKEAERSRIIQEAEGKGIWEQAKAAGASTIKDPALLVSFLAEMAPNMLPVGAAARLGRGVVLGSQLGKGVGIEAAELAAQKAGTRAALGSGAVMQGADIGTDTYEEAYKELIAKDVPPDQAKQRALNLARASGLSAAAVSLLAQKLPGARQLEESFAGKAGVAGRAVGALKTGLGEAYSEGIEEGGGAFGKNLAMRDINPEYDLTKGVGTAAALGAIGGGGIGAVTGALQRQAPSETLPEAPPIPEPTEPKAVEPLRIGYNPTVEDVVEKDPLQNPVGNLMPNELTPDIVKFVNNRRKEEGKPKLKAFSIEDLVEAGAPPQEIDRLLAYKNRFDGSVTLSAADVNNVAQQKNVDTETKGFTDFLRRATGQEDLNQMSQPQLHSAFVALNALDESPELKVLPEGTNAVRFTDKQYDQGMRGISFKLGQSPAVGRASVIQQIKDYTKLENDQDANMLLRTAIRNGDLESKRVPQYEVGKEDENGLFKTFYVSNSREAAKTGAAKLGNGYTVRDGFREEISFPGEVTELPGGPDIRMGMFREGEKPEGFEIKAGSDVLSASNDELDANEKAARLGTLREKEAKATQKEIDELNKQILANQNELERLEATGQGRSLEFSQLSASVYADSKALADQVNELKKKLNDYQQPVTVVPTKSVTPIVREGFTFFDNGAAVASFPTKQQAEEFALSRLNDETLTNIVNVGPTLKGLMPKRLAKMAEAELASRGRTEPGIEVKFTGTEEEARERLAKLGIFSADVQSKVAELEKALLPALRKLGLERVALNIVREIENNAEGNYAAGVIKISLDNEPGNYLGVLRHESIHALKELGAFTDKEWAVLNKQAKEVWVPQYMKNRATEYKGKQTSLYDAYADIYRKKNKNLKGFDEYIQEEAIAEAFRYWKPQAGFFGNMGYRLSKMFDVIKNAFKGLGFRTADSVFEKIEAGKMRPKGEEKGKAKFSLRQYKLDIKRQKRVVQEIVDLPVNEQAAIERDAQEMDLPKARVDELIKQVKADKKRYPEKQGWAPLEVIGIDVTLDDEGKPIRGTEAPKYKSIPYEYNVPTGKNKAPTKVDPIWLGKVTKEFQKLVQQIYTRASKGDTNAQGIIAHQTWYKNVAKTLRNEYGGFGDVLADLLGATSPNTPVDTNWRFSIDVMRRFVRGDFNPDLEKFSKHLEDGKPASSFPSQDKIRQISGKLYGMNSTNAMLALVDAWRQIKPGQAPKARNFALNLIGQSNIATIDVWAARMLRRAANAISKGEYARIPPPAEKGVSGVWNTDATEITGAFGFGAEVMRQVSANLKKKGINIEPPDLQAIAWFAEKELWGTKGWTSKVGEGGSFEENIEKNPADRYLAGHSIQVGETTPLPEEVYKVQQDVLGVLQKDPNVIAVRVKPTKGLYGGTVEESFDSEWVVDRNTFKPDAIVSKIAEVSKANQQYDIFVSRVIPPNEDNPNARPGIELYFKTEEDLNNVMPILKSFTDKGQDGFTLAVDPRATGDSNLYMGVRLQYVPEISMRWDEELREKLKDPKELERILEEKTQTLNNIANEVAQEEGVAYAAMLKYDTIVIGKENYDAYISGATPSRDSAAGEKVWFGQPVRDHVEAAAKRYTAGQVDEAVVPDGGEAEARYSLRSTEPSVRPSTGGGRGITLGERQEGAGTFSGIHYGKAKTERLSGAMFGSGIRGEESKRLAQSRDPRIKRRVYFYIPNEVGFVMRPEAGLGQHVYTQTFDNILPSGDEMSRLYRSVDKDFNAFESAVIDSGYDGYAVPSQGMMVILNHNVPVKYEGLANELRTQGKLVNNKIKYSLRANPAQTETPEFKRWFGKSKIVNKDGEPKVMYHGTARDITTFRPKQAGAIFVTDKPSFAQTFAHTSEEYMEKEFFSKLSNKEKETLFRSVMEQNKDKYTELFGEEWYREALDTIKYSQSLYKPSTGIRSLPAIFGEGAKVFAGDVVDKISQNLDSRANIMPVYVKAENPFDYDNRLHYKILLEDNDIDDYDIREMMHGDWETIESESIQEAIRNAGFDGFYVKEHGVKNLAVYEPSQIKSATGNVGTFDINNPDIRYSVRANLPPATNARIDATTGQRKTEGFMDRILSIFNPDTRAKLRAGFIFQFEALERGTKARAAKYGNREYMADVSATAAALESMRSKQIVAAAMRDGVPVYRNGFTTTDNLNGTQKGLLDIFSPLAATGDPDVWRCFQYYAGSKRGARLDAEGREHLFTPADVQAANAMAAQFKRDGIDFDAVYKEYQKWNDALVKYMKDTGVLSAADAAYFTKFGDYIPFYRQMEGESTVGPKIFSAIAGVQKPKTLKGGTEKLGDFLENVIRNASAAVDAGMKNVAANRGIRDALDLGTARQVNVPNQDSVSVKENGVTKHYELDDPLLFEAFKGLNVPRMPWLQVLAAPANVLRNFVTKDPGFILANIMRDSVSAWVTSGSDMKPVIDSFKQFGKILAGQSPEAVAMAKAGLGGYEFKGSLKDSAEAFEKALRAKTGTRTKTEKALLPVTVLWDMLEQGSNASDMATRAEIYKRVLAETGNEAEAMFQASEAMNFSRRGNFQVMQILTAVVPFMNARIQGLDVLYRSGFGQAANANKERMQKAFIVRSLSILAMTAAYWALVHDDDEYKKLTKEERDGYWIVPGLTFNGKPFRFPIPFELGVLFKVFPERILEYTMGQDTEKDFRESITRNIVDTLKFNPIPQAFIPIYENISNHSFFTGEKIIGRGLEDVAKPLQYNASTSMGARWLGEQTGMSPIQIDNVIRGYTGTMGMYAVNMLDSVFSSQGDPVKATTRAEQLPVIKRFFASDSGTVAQYYDLKDEVDEVVRTVNFLERNDPDKLEAYLKDNENTYMLKDFVRSIDKDMKQIREYRGAVNADPNMSGDEKRAILDELHDYEVALTSDIKAIRKEFH